LNERERRKRYDRREIFLAKNVKGGNKNLCLREGKKVKLGRQPQITARAKKKKEKDNHVIPQGKEGKE